MIDVELGALLADASQAAAYFIDVRDRAAVVEAANVLGYHVADANLEAADDKAALLDALAAALEFPATFGGNWDALADSLGDLSWRPAPGYVLLLDHCSGLREDEADDFAILLGILDEAARVHAERGVPFWAVLPLPSQSA